MKINKKNLKDYLIKEFKIDRKVLKDNYNLINNSHLDSLGMINLIFYIEKKLKKKLKNKILIKENFKDIETIFKTIQSINN